MSEKKEKAKMPAMQLVVTINVNDYTIEFPNNDKLIRIERLKSDLMGGYSQDIIRNGASGVRAFTIASAIATFQILLADKFKDSLNVSLLELNPLQSKTLIKAYEKYYFWMEEWDKFLNDEEVEDDK